MFEKLKAATRKLFGHQPLSRLQLRQQHRQKPRQLTIMRRKTMRNLAYLQDHGLTPKFKANYLVPKNLRTLMGGKFIDPQVATHGV